MKRIDLNVDIGEGFPHDEALLEYATSANICCGEHAGSWEITQRTIDLCLRKGARIGCHPGFPDRAHFGRVAPNEEQAGPWVASISEQVKKFYEVRPPAYIKPHGALYNIVSTISPNATKHEQKLMASCSGLIFGFAQLRPRAAIMLLPESFVAKGLRMTPLFATFIKEGFADRRYTSEGFLVPRSEPNAVLEDQEQIQEQIRAIAPKVDSICLHGDTPNCLTFAELVHKTLFDESYEVGF